LALLGRLSWERVSGFVMQASEKPAQERSFADERRIADFDPLRKFGSEFSMMAFDPKRSVVSYRRWEGKGLVP
jgi:hypothetical protein